MALVSSSKFECPICLEDFKAPKILPCYHSMCCECLKSYVEENSRLGRFPCPVCKTTVKRPVGGVKDFQTNFYLTSQRQSLTTTAQEVCCDVCFEQRAATNRCAACRQNLCEPCCHLHSQLSATRNHTLSEIKQTVKQSEGEASPFPVAGQQFISGFGGISDISQIYRDMFTYYVHSMVVMVTSPGTDDSRKMWGLQRLHEAFRRSQDHRELAGGELGLMKDLLDMITERIEKNPACDAILIRLWSMVVSLTDNTVPNCHLFLLLKGLDQFSVCSTLFRDEADLVSELTLVMGNISECKQFRPLLMEKEFVTFFRQLVRREDVPMVTRFASLAFLVHLVSDGADHWLLSDEASCTYDMVVEDIYSVIDSWQPDVDISVAFRSLQPMLDHVQNISSPVCQYWAAWTINNRIISDPEKYCEIVWKEEGQEILELVTKQPDCSRRLKDIIITILQQMTQ